MCRFALYLGAEITLSSLVTDPENSIIHQSFKSREREEPLNGDGFGVAWYVPQLSSAPAIFKDLTPAWSNQNLLHLAGVTRSHCILAHVRAASPGLPVTQLNCHPFAWGDFAFMHNGNVGGFQRILRRLRQRLSDTLYHHIQGSTDSEHLFALFVEHYLRNPHPEPLERMAGALAGAIAEVEELGREAEVEEPSYLNLAVTDGHRAVVSRFVSRDTEATSLHVSAGRQYTCKDGVCRMLPAESHQHAVLVASEPLSDEPSWRTVEVNNLLLIDEHLAVEHRPIVI